jgi:proline dehydrogenase
MRRLLLWMAGNRRLREWVPRLWFARRAVRRFMPGEDAGAALDAAERFRRDRIGVLFTRLGENLTRIDEADEVADHYLRLYDEIERRGLDAEVSVKLTQLGMDLDVERAVAHAERLADRAASLKGVLWIDMEGSAYTGTTIDVYERLKGTRPNIGIALQAYLRPTADDITRLLPLDPAIRLVKGAYAEPAELAFQRKDEVDEAFVRQALQMVEGRRAGREVRIALGTHDVRLIEQIAREAALVGVGRSQLEIQMLYGIREDQQRRLTQAGFPVRTLIAYGEHWYPWYMRRLAERPANVLFVLRQLLP